MERLGEVVVGAVLHGGDRAVDAAMRGQQQHLHFRLAFLELGQELDAVHAGHVQVEKRDVEATLLSLCESVFAASGCRHRHSLASETPRQRLTQLVVVINNEQSDRCWHGRGHEWRKETAFSIISIEPCPASRNDLLGSRITAGLLPGMARQPESSLPSPASSP